jgi:histidyl-tRNA synthetase
VGIERLVTLIGEKRKSEGGKKTDTRVFVAAVKPEIYSYACKVAAQMREAGISAETDLNERHLRKQFDYANSLSIPFVAIVGEREAKENGLTLRDMVSGKEEQLPLERAIAIIKGA